MITLERVTTNQFKKKMPDQQTTPVSEEEPRPVNTNVQVAGGESVQPIGQPRGSVLTPQPPSPPTKKRFPKTTLLIVAFVLIFTVLVVLAIRFRSSGVNIFGESGEIIWWGVTYDKSAVEPLIAEYKEENPRVKITYIKQSPQDYRERLTNALARGVGPDIFEFHNSWVPMFKNDLDVLPSSVMDKQEFASTFYSVITSDLTTEDGIVGIPLGYDAITLFINEDIFAAGGKTPPSTWDEFRQTALDLTTKDNRQVVIQSGTAMGRTENIDHWQDILALMMYQNRVNLANPTGVLAEDALEFYTVFSTKDKIWSETFPSSTAAFANGKVAMYFGPSWRANEINSMNPGLRFKTVPLPQLRKDDPTEPDMSYATYWVEGVWARSANRELAWEFLDYLVSSNSLEKLYENTKSAQLVGKPYPRLDMNNLLIRDSILGSVVALAPNAQSWYLADETFDGATGINSQVSEVFRVAVDAVNKGRRVDKELEKVATEIVKVLSKFGIRFR
ncbi:MAG: ABC transporter substrate-binding protein [Patescibacteria group bacterium]